VRKPRLRENTYPIELPDSWPFRICKVCCALSVELYEIVEMRAECDGDVQGFTYDCRLNHHGQRYNMTAD
jgi:hypothetical protein